MVASAQQSSLARSLIIGASIVIIVAGIRAGAPILAPVLLALLLAVAVSPMLRWLQARGLPRWLALLVMIVTLLVIALTFIAVLYASLNQLAAGIPVYQEILLARGAALGSWLAGMGVNISGVLSSGVIDTTALARTAVEAASGLIAGLSQAFFILTIMLLVLGEAPSLSTRLGRALPAGAGLTAGFARFSQAVQGQLRVQTLGNLAVSLSFTFALLILRVDFAVLWGIGTFFLTYIPNIGATLSAIPPILVAYLQYGTGTALAVLASIVVLNVAWDNVIAPRAMGRGFNLSPVVVLLSFIFWSWVFGVIGAMLAFPLTVALKLLLEASGETRWMAVAMSATPPSSVGSPTPEAKGLDQEQATIKAPD